MALLASFVRHPLCLSSHAVPRVAESNHLKFAGVSLCRHCVISGNPHLPHSLQSKYEDTGKHGYGEKIPSQRSFVNISTRKG